MSLCINIHYKGMVKDISEIVVNFALIQSQNALILLNNLHHCIA